MPTYQDCLDTWTRHHSTVVQLRIYIVRIIRLGLLCSRTQDATYCWLWTHATYRCWHVSICRSVGCIWQCGSRHASAAYADIILRSGRSGSKLVHLIAARSYTTRPINDIQFHTTPSELLYRVCQGSFLWPILFLLYMYTADLLQLIERHHFIPHAYTLTGFVSFLIEAWQIKSNQIKIYIAPLYSRRFRGQRVRLASTTCLGGRGPAGFSWITRRAKWSAGNSYWTSPHWQHFNTAGVVETLESTLTLTSPWRLALL